MKKSIYTNIKKKILHNYYLRKLVYTALNQPLLYKSKIFNYFYDNYIEKQKKKFIDFPDGVELELTSHCNVACSFCPHPIMERSKGIMEISLIKKIIDDCSKNKINDINLCGFGEPLLDKRITEIITYAKQKNIPRVRITTTGYLLNKELSKKLLESGIDEINISLDASTSETYDKIRIIKTKLKDQKSHFDVVMNNIIDLTEIMKTNKYNTKVHVRCLMTEDNKKDVPQFIENFKDKHPNLLSEIWFNLHNWGDALKNTSKPVGIKKPCHNLWKGMIVRYNGDVSICCLDYENKEVMGNLLENSISELWNNKKYLKYREFHNKGEHNKVSVCKDCHIPYAFTGQWL